MQTLRGKELVGFVKLDLGSLSIRVPVRSVQEDEQQPLAEFEAEGEAIVVRGDTSSLAVEVAMKQAVHDAARHFSRKLLN